MRADHFLSYAVGGLSWRISDSCFASRNKPLLAAHYNMPTVDPSALYIWPATPPYERQRHMPNHRRVLVSGFVRMPACHFLISTAFFDVYAGMRNARLWLAAMRHVLRHAAAWNLSALARPMTMLRLPVQPSRRFGAIALRAARTTLTSPAFAFAARPHHQRPRLLPVHFCLVCLPPVAFAPPPPPLIAG